MQNKIRIRNDYKDEVLRVEALARRALGISNSR
jgi:hypothetical protein